MSGNLFISTARAQTLSEFGHFIQGELGIAELAERESSNYLDGRYLVGRCMGMVVKLSRTDDNDLASYPFWINLNADGFNVSRPNLLDDVSDLIARKLTILGCKVARCSDIAKIGASIWQYSIRDNALGNEIREVVCVSSNPVEREGQPPTS